MADSVSELRVVVSAETDEAERSLKSLSSNVSSFGDSFKQGLGIGTGVALMQAGFQAIGSGLGALKSSVIDFNQQLDQSRAVFTRYFEGNSQLAEQFLNTLKGFAATTPFEFKDLSTLAIRLQNANTNANDIIPTLKAIGNAASASGSLSQESIGRITTALTQMQMRGKVTGEEMMQLTEAGVPAWNILAEATGKPIGQLQKMASQGEITADVFIGAFRGMYENAGLMEGASKSLTGALSTIRDVGTQAFAEVGRSVFDLATQGANALAGFLSSTDFQAWVGAAKLGVDALVEGVRGLIAVFQPVGEVIAAAFRQFTSGDFSGAFATIVEGIQTALSGAVASVQAFAEQMFGAGVNLIGELAGGIIDGAGQALTAAIDTVTSTIAAFLIGNSPPSDGPLAKIREGGANTIAAWGEGAAQAADGAVKPAADAIKANLSELKIAGRDVDASIRDISQSMQDVERTSRDLKHSADDIKSAYNEQIGAVDDQIKSLEKAHDTQRDREKLELNLEEIQLRQAEIAALGDKELRAQLQVRLETLKGNTADRKNQEALADAQRAITGSDKDRLKAQLDAAKELASADKERLKAKLDAQKLDQQEKDLRERLGKAKPEERGRIEEQLKELGLRRQMEAADKLERDREAAGRKALTALDAKDREEAAQRKLLDAEAKQEELSIQGQIGRLVDTEGLARIKHAQEALKSRKEELTLAEQAERIQREIAVAPLKEEREALTAQRDAMLKPLQEQLETLNRQKESLGEQRQEMQNYKADIAATAQGFRDQETAIKAGEQALKDQAKAAKEAAVSAPMPGIDKAFTPDAAAEAAIKRAKEAGEKLATGLRDGFAGMFDKLIPQSIRDALDGISARLSTDGIPGLIQTIGNGLAAAVPVFASKLAAWVGVFLDWARENQSRLLERLAELRGAIRAWMGEAAGAIGEALYEWTLAFVNWATENGPALLDKLAGMGSDILKWIGDEAKDIAGQLLDWATEFVAWVGPRIPELLGELGELGASMIEWMGRQLGDLLDALGKWAVEFVNWVGPKIGPLLLELGGLLVKVTEWIVLTALPAIAKKLAEWGLAIVDWVAPRILPLLEELGKVLLAIGTWIIFNALPAIGAKLAEWGKAFLDWVTTDVLPHLPETLWEIVKGINQWILDTQETIATEAAKVGKAMLEGIQTGLSDNWGRLKDWIDENIGKKLPEWMQNLLGIHSPSTVFADMGRNMILGLISGMESKSGELLESARRLFDFRGAMPGGAMPGEVTDWLRSAMAHTGVPESWLEPLKWIVDHESSGKPTAKNPNSTASGLFQIIDTTWNAYRDKTLPNNIFDPIINAIGGIRYIKGRYGDPWAAVDYWRANNHYAEGGWAGLNGPELAWLGERGPEYVVSNAALGKGAGGGMQVIRVDVAIGGKVARQIVVEGYDLAVRQGWTPGGLTG